MVEDDRIEAIFEATDAPSHDRGVIKPGLWADPIAFDAFGNLTSVPNRYPDWHGAARYGNMGAQHEQTCSVSSGDFHLFGDPATLREPRHLPRR